MKKLAGLILFLQLSMLSHAQLYDGFERFSMSSTRSTKDTFFIPEKIKTQNIRSVCIIDSVKNAGEDFGDTVLVIEFDKSGNAVREIAFLGGERRSDLDLIEQKRNSTKNWYDDKVIKTSVTSKDSTARYFVIDSIEGKIDTAVSYKWVYDKQGRLLEIKKKTSPARLHMLDCSVGTFKHETYEYDAQGRIITERSYGPDKSNYSEWKTTYTDFGYTREHFDSFHTSIWRKTVLINKTDEMISESDGSYLFLVEFSSDGLPSQAILISDYANMVIDILDFVYKKF